MFPGLNYSGLTRFAKDGGSIKPKKRKDAVEEMAKESEQREIIMDALFDSTRPGMNEDLIAERMFDAMRRQELNPMGRKDGGLMQLASAPDPMAERMDMMENLALDKFGKPLSRLTDDEVIQIEEMIDDMMPMAMGGRVNMGLGGLLGRAFREGMEAAMKNPNLGKIFGKSGGDLDIGDIIKMEKPVPKVSPRDSRVGGIDLFGRRRQREIDTLQDDVIDQMMEMDSIEGFAMGGSIPQTNSVPSGMQLDGRGGGFIPMGAKERKDDVPAMLAKNEFVMTADAVRGAGDGNVNVGAQRMYDLMNSLESKV